MLSRTLCLPQTFCIFRYTHSLSLPPAPVSSLTLSLLLPFTSKQSDVAASMFLNECGCSWILWCNTGIISPSFHCNSEKQTITPSSPSSPLPSSYATLGDADWGSLPSRVLKKLTVLLFWNQDKFICVRVMHRYVKAITESQQVYFYLSVNIYTGGIPNLEWAHMYVWGSHWQTCRHVKVENVGTDSMEKRLNIQQEVGEKERVSTIVTLQLCTINRISTHTHTHIQRFFLHVSAWHPHTHRKATYVIQSGIFLLCFQVYGKEPKHTHTEKPWWAPVQGKELRWNAHKHTLWAAIQANGKTEENDSLCLCVLGTARGGDDWKKKKKKK